MNHKKINNEKEKATERDDGAKRVNFLEEERKYWEGWLPDKLGNRAKEIKKLVKHLYETKEKEVPLKHYTPHGVKHCESVEDNLHRLIPGKLHKKLSEAEKFFLISSAWTHDIGMLRSVLLGITKQGVTGIDDEDDEKIREFHHVRSELFIMNHYDEVGILEEEATAFSLLAKFHRRRCDIETCPDYLAIPKHGTIRLRLLAAYLRLADALHIDQSRTPEAQYAISLAYNIPYKSKLHWYRSKFVHGVEVNIKDKEIIIQLKKPNTENIEHGKRLSRAYDSIYEFIINDLSEELDSLKNILFKAGITYFLSVKKSIHVVEVNERFRQDVEPVLNYYYLLDNPSSSGLLSLVLLSAGGIIDSGKKRIHEEIEKTVVTTRIKKRLSSFLDEVKENVLFSRKCHIGLANFIKEFKEIIDNENKSIDDIESYIAERDRLIKENKLGVKHSAANYLRSIENIFSAVINKFFDALLAKKYETCDSNKDNTDKINILLYGYSELVIGTLCGFRNEIISKFISLHCGKNDECKKKCDNCLAGLEFYRIHNLQEIEEAASNCFRIFCCEGQPKNHTTWSGRFHHHDGSRYAITLAENNFKEIYIIPDASSASLLSHSVNPDRNDKNHIKFPEIHFIIIGANGFDNYNFRHSAGHSMVVAASFLAKRLNRLNKMSIKTEKKETFITPKLILSLMTDKFNSQDNKEEITKTEKLSMTEGWYFKSSFSGEQVRGQSFFMQDPVLQKELEKYKDVIKFYNPREDSLGIGLVDVIISEKGFLKREEHSKKEWNGEYISKHGR